jgi:hypothetical protein
MIIFLFYHYYNLNFENVKKKERRIKKVSRKNKKFTNLNIKNK